MVKSNNSDSGELLNNTFEALGNEHRRVIVSALALRPHSISELAELRSLSLPAIHKHIIILEKGGLLTRKKIGRTHFLAIKRGSLSVVQNWLNQFRTYWGSDSESLENYVQYLQK